MSQDGRSQGGGGGGGCVGGAGTTTPPQASPITLTVPRPDHQRATNLYVDTPFKHRVAPRTRTPHHTLPARTSSLHADLPLVHGAPARSSGKRPLTSAKLAAAQSSTSVGGKGAVGSVSGGLAGTGSRTPVITKQPAALTFTKGGRDDTDGESIICSWCGRCRCEACTKPRPPPAAWLCRNKCLCSPSAVVDYASCLCCVKGLLYHCGTDGDSGLAAAADNPCSCSGPHTLLSWACLAVASVPLPCLLCYWPLTGLRKGLETVYQRCTSHGCRCPQGVAARHHHPPPSPEKRPLHDCA